jgi:ferredoxin-NADP reductase
LTTLTLTVAAVHTETPIIRTIELRAQNELALPAYTPGAHLKVSIPGQAEPRCYSLVCLEESESPSAPTCYRLGIRLETPSTGGSQHMHGLKVGDVVQVEYPRNDFALHEAIDQEQPVILIAGGIGITPIASMAESLNRAKRPYQLHYYGRSRAHMAFLAQLSQRFGPALAVHADDDPDSLLAIDALLEQSRPQQHIYVCGPKGLIDLVLDLAQARGWPREHLHFELFVAAATQSGDRAFEVELRQSGQVFQVPPDKTILEVLEQAGCDPFYDCKRGECGVCQATVLEGIPDHRDYYLSDAEKKAGNVIQLCISRSLSDRLVLDL